jgi:hypothetical protein
MNVSLPLEHWYKLALPQTSGKSHGVFVHSKKWIEAQSHARKTTGTVNKPVWANVRTATSGRPYWVLFGVPSHYVSALPKGQEEQNHDQIKRIVGWNFQSLHYFPISQMKN